MSLLAFLGQDRLYLTAGLVHTCFSHKHFTILILEEIVCLQIKLKLQNTKQKAKQKNQPEGKCNCPATCLPSL